MPIKTDIWKKQVEKDYFPCEREWFCAEAVLRNKNKKYILKTVFTQWSNKNQPEGSYLSITLFDLKKDKDYSYYSCDKENKLETSEREFFICYKNSKIKGNYPNYKLKLFDEENKIEINLDFSAKSSPQLIAYDKTNGYIPMGLGFYKFGFVPRSIVSGTIKIDKEIFEVNGNGYFEHVWGDISYTNPFSTKSDIKKSISSYVKFFEWWKKNQKFKLPKSLEFCSENNPFGYDWIWCVFDNNWSIFYGNIMFWISKGPTAGILYLTKDGNNYSEFLNMRFEYTKMKSSKLYDFYYPVEIELTAENEKEKIFLKCSPVSGSHEGITRPSKSKYWKGFVVCEVPVKIQGWYENGSEKVILKGNGKFEPQRLVSMFGHNKLKADFCLPPEGFGIDFKLDSNYFQKDLFFKFRFLPELSLKINLKRK